MTLDANWGPLLEITCWGRPVRRQTWFIYSWEVCSAIMVFRQGVKIMALLKRSMTTNMESEFRDSGRSVTKSIVMDFHTPVGIWFGCRGILVFGLFFVDWHTAQPSTKFFVNWESPGYQYSLETSSYVFQRPGWPVARCSWYCLMMSRCRLSSFGM